MKTKLKLLLLLLFGLTFCTVRGQAVDSLQTAVALQPDSTGHDPAADNPEAYDDTPFTAAFMVAIMIGTALLIGCVIAGAVVMMGLLFALFTMVSLGIVSTAIVVALHQKSFEKGFRTFVLLLCSIGGLTLGAVAFGVANRILHWVTLGVALLTGAGFGLVAGLVLGYANLFIIKRFAQYFKNFLQLKQ
jgi:small-conductance mechanosensitive channel